MISFPNAKINLGLHIINKREDGYHNLETCFYPVPWFDVLEILPAAKSDFFMSGIPIAGNPENNLCLKAYQLLKQDYKLPEIQMHLHKNIPMGAGLGGGSSDAAFTLTTLNKLFELNLTSHELTGNAAKLGSDCAFFVEHKPTVATGRGELLETIDLNLSGTYCVIIYPGINVPTQEAYSLIKPKAPSGSLKEVLKKERKEWKNQLVNDFEEPILQKYPEIKEVRELLYQKGSYYACMSGSGSSVFGLFPTEIDLKAFFPAAYIIWQGYL